MKINNNSVTDPLLIAEAFNDYFSNIASTLQVDSSSIPDLSPLANFIENRNPPNVSFELKPINHLIVQKELQALQPKAVGLDGVGQRILNSLLPLLHHPFQKLLTPTLHLANFLLSGKMPRCFVYTKLVIFPIVPTIDRSLCFQWYPKSSSGMYLTH